MSDKNVQIRYKNDDGYYDKIYPKTKSEIVETSDGEPIEDKIDRLSSYTDTKVDKKNGKQLSSNDFTTLEKEKLSGVEEGANKYIHPETHPASMIEQSTSRQFIRDNDRRRWDDKQDKLGYTPENRSDKGRVNGYAGLDSDAKIPLENIPDLSRTPMYVVQNKLERENLSDINEGDKAYELNSKIIYIWDGSDWNSLTEDKGESVSLEWININGRPNSSPKDIDESVNKSHSHGNGIVLDNLSDAGSKELAYKGESITKPVKEDIKRHRENKNNPHEVTPEIIGAETPEKSQDRADKVLEDAKSYTDNSHKYGNRFELRYNPSYDSLDVVVT